MMVRAQALGAVCILCAVSLPAQEARGATAVAPIGFREAVAMAVATSAELRTEYAMKALREGAWALGFRSYLPRLSLSAGEDDRLSTVGTDSFTKTYTASITQLVFDGGRLALARSMEKADLAVHSDELRRKAADLAEAAVSSYRAVISGRALVSIREETLLALEEQRRILAEELDRGLALRTDLAEADISLAESMIEIRSLLLELRESERLLAEALGLRELPPLADRIDPNRASVVPKPEAAAILAAGVNPELRTLRHGVAKSQAEARRAERAWIPTVKAAADYTLSGGGYPLTRRSWNLALTLEFSSPTIAGSLSSSAGWEPPYDRTARAQARAEPLGDPAAALSARSARMALGLESERLRAAVERIGRRAESAVEACLLADQGRLLALRSSALAEERLALAELKLRMGQATRLEYMKAHIERAKKEAAAVEAAAALLAKERELESLLDLAPGGLAELRPLDIGRSESGGLK